MSVQLSNYNAAHLKLLMTTTKKNNSGMTKENLNWKRFRPHLFNPSINCNWVKYFSNTLANIQSYVDIALLLFLLAMNFILELFGIKQCWTNPWKTQELGTLTLCRVKNPHVAHSRPSIYMLWILCVCGSTSSHSTSLTHAIMILLAGENVCVYLVCGVGWWDIHMGVYVYICECIFIHMGVYESVCFWGGDHVCSLTVSPSSVLVMTILCYLPIFSCPNASLTFAFQEKLVFSKLLIL